MLKKFSALSAVSLLLWSGFALADQASSAREEVQKRCQADPKWCAEMKAQVKVEMQEEQAKRLAEKKKWCATNPEACKKEQEEVQALKAKCEATPAQCDTFRKELREKHQKEKQEAQKKWCESNPQRCEQWKADMRKLEERMRAEHNKLQEQYPDRP